MIKDMKIERFESDFKPQQRLIVRVWRVIKKIFRPGSIVTIVAGGIIVFWITQWYIPKPPLKEYPGKNGGTFQAKGEEEKRWWMSQQEKRTIEAYNEGVIALDKKQYDIASSKFSEAISLNPKYLEAYNNLGTTLHMMGKDGEAEKVLRKMLDLKPDNPEANYIHSNIGLLLWKQRKYREAEKEFLVSIKLNQNYDGAYLNYGEMLYEEGKRNDEAEQQFRRAIQLNPKSFEAHNNLGAILLGKEKIEEAEKEIREALRIKSDYAGAYTNLGMFFDKKGEPDSAIGAYRESIRFDPNIAEAHNNLGVGLGNKGMHLDGEKEIRLAIQLAPSEAVYHYNLGIQLYAQGKFEEAVAECRVAIRLKPDYVDPYNNLGSYLFDLGNYKDAERVCRDAIRLKPNNIEARNTLGITLRFQGKIDEAIIVLREAARLNTTIAGSYFNLGLALAEKGKFVEAEQAYRSYNHLAPNESRGLEKIAICLDRQDKRKEGRIFWEKALPLEKDTSRIRTIKERLAKVN